MHFTGTHAIDQSALPPDQVEKHIEATSRDLGRPGLDPRYGWGLVDAARALRCPAYTAC